MERMDERALYDLGPAPALDSWPTFFPSLRTVQQHVLFLLLEHFPGYRSGLAPHLPQISVEMSLSQPSLTSLSKTANHPHLQAFLTPPPV